MSRFSVGRRYLDPEHRARSVNELALKDHKIERALDRLRRRRGPKRPLGGPQFGQRQAVGARDSLFAPDRTLAMRCAGHAFIVLTRRAVCQYAVPRVPSRPSKLVRLPREIRAGAAWNEVGSVHWTISATGSSTKPPDG